MVGNCIMIKGVGGLFSFITFITLLSFSSLDFCFSFIFFLSVCIHCLLYQSTNWRKGGEVKLFCLFHYYLSYRFVCTSCTFLSFMSCWMVVTFCKFFCVCFLFHGWKVCLVYGLYVVRHSDVRVFLETVGIRSK